MSPYINSAKQNKKDLIKKNIKHSTKIALTLTLTNPTKQRNENSLIIVIERCIDPVVGR